MIFTLWASSNGTQTRAWATSLLGLLMGTLLAVSVAAFLAATHENRAAALAETQMVHDRLEQRIQNLERTLLDYAWWDDALEALTDDTLRPAAETRRAPPDLAWADRNLGASLYERFGFGRVLVFAPNDRVMLAYGTGKEMRPDAALIGLPEADIQAVIDQARLYRPPGPRPETRIVQAHDGLHLVAAVRIVPELSSVAAEYRPPNGGTILVFTQKVDDARLNIGSARPLLSELQVTAADSASGAGVVLPLGPRASTTAQALTWAPSRPGDSFLMAMMLPGLVALLAVAAGSFGVLHGLRHDDRQRAAHLLEVEATRDQLRRTTIDLQASLEAQATANAARTVFLANMSHELRTPLNAVIGFSEVMMAEIHGPLGNDHYAGYVENIRSSGLHLLGIINDILDLSKLDAGRFSVSEDAIDLGGCAETVLRLMQPQADEAQVALKLELANPLPRLLADAGRMRQVLFNLLSNAVKFTPPEGRVMLAIRTTAEGGLTLTVTDTGIGMDEQGIAIAVTPFGQVDGSLARRHGGTGLGLPISIRLVEMQGGTLTIDSVKGSGTTICMHFPAGRVLPPRPTHATTLPTSPDDRDPSPVSAG